jgi:hypothetical protein
MKAPINIEIPANKADAAAALRALSIAALLFAINASILCSASARETPALAAI